MNIEIKLEEMKRKMADCEDIVKEIMPHATDMETLDLIAQLLARMDTIKIDIMSISRELSQKPWNTLNTL